MRNWKSEFNKEFGIHFSKSELQFVHEFIEELILKEKSKLFTGWEKGVEKEIGGKIMKYKREIIDKLIQKLLKYQNENHKTNNRRS